MDKESTNYTTKIDRPLLTLTKTNKLDFSHIYPTPKALFSREKL